MVLQTDVLMLFGVKHRGKVRRLTVEGLSLTLGCGCGDLGLMVIRASIDGAQDCWSRTRLGLRVDGAMLLPFLALIRKQPAW